MRLRALLLVAALGAVGLLAVGAPALAGGRPLSATLTGAAEVPGPGDADASGTALITLNEGQGEVCFDLDWAGIDGTVVAAHIHAAPAGVSGVSEELIKAIRHDPAGYYVNIHSTVFPAGAVRGQLSR